MRQPTNCESFDLDCPVLSLMQFALKLNRPCFCSVIVPFSLPGLVMQPACHGPAAFEEQSKVVLLHNIAHDIMGAQDGDDHVAAAQALLLCCSLLERLGTSFDCMVA